jgi:hypothetical protein
MRAIVPTAAVSDDPHVAALWRLAGVAQYLYDTMGGDYRSSGDRPSPLPALATENLREAQRRIDKAIGAGLRIRRVCLGGELDLVEFWRDRPDICTPRDGLTQLVEFCAERPLSWDVSIQPDDPRPNCRFRAIAHADHGRYSCSSGGPTAEHAAASLVGALRALETLEAGPPWASPPTERNA